MRDASAVEEFGGYLPLELARGREHYSDRSGWHVARLNSGRAALESALITLEAKRVFYPSYYCPSTLDSLKSSGRECIPYPVTKDLLPPEQDFATSDGDVVIIVDFFGICTDAVNRAAERFNKVVMDFCHSFFAPPLSGSNVVNVYSCRKFLGVSDGAYAISSRELEVPNWMQDSSAARSIHLIGSIEEGTGAYYQASIDSKRGLSEFRLMSEFTRRMLDSMAYDEIAAQRRANYGYLRDLLAPLQELPVPSDPCSPWCYPLLTDRRGLREALVKRKVYVPRIWESFIGIEPNDTTEYLLSNYLVCLPIDQRYGRDDMQRLARIVRDEWEDCI